MGEAMDRKLNSMGGDLLTRCQQAYRVGQNYFEQAAASAIRDSYDRFYSRHPAGSKYNTEAFAKRSKLFRPKTRVSVRALEAAAAVAGFTTQEFVACAPYSKRNPKQRKAAEMHQNLLNRRLSGATYTKSKIPWYRVYMGGVQEAIVTGTVISKQTWEMLDYEDVKTTTMQDVQTGAIFERKEKRRVVEYDRPKVQLIPLEQLKIDPAAEWDDPIGTAGFLIHDMPMRVMDVRERMTAKGIRKWANIDDNALLAAMSTDYSSLQRARDGNKDRKEEVQGLDDYSIVWVQEHTHRRKDGDKVVYVLGNTVLLTGELPIEEVYPHGRPFAMGSSVIEAHRLYSSGVPEISAQLQDEVNNVVNLRMDNVTLAMMGRYFYKRGSSVDVRTLLGGVPGSAVGVSRIDDVKWDRPSDVTRGAYEEQDRLSLDFDDATGTMSQSSVMSNRALNETVGGMNLLQGGQTMVQDYILRTVISTWVEVVLQQLIEMQVYYETDEEMIYTAAEAVGIDTTTDQGKAEAMELLQIRVIASADVGFGATSPDKRIGRLTMALGAISNTRPDLMMRMDGNELVKEVLGAVGHDASRFFPDLDGQKQDPMVQQLQQQVAELQKVIETKQIETQGRIDVAKVSAQGAIDREKVRLEAELPFKKAMAHLEERRVSLDEMIEAAKTDAERSALILQREALNKSIFDTEREYVLQLYTMGLLPGVQPMVPMEGIGGSDGPVPHGDKGEEPRKPVSVPQGEMLTGQGGDVPQFDSLEKDPPDMPGDDKGGTLARDDYGDVPFGAQ